MHCVWAYTWRLPWACFKGCGAPRLAPPAAANNASGLKASHEAGQYEAVSCCWRKLIRAAIDVPRSEIDSKLLTQPCRRSTCKGQNDSDARPGGPGRQFACKSGSQMQARTLPHKGWPWGRRVPHPQGAKGGTSAVPRSTDAAGGGGRHGTRTPSAGKPAGCSGAQGSISRSCQIQCPQRGFGAGCNR